MNERNTFSQPVTAEVPGAVHQTDIMRQPVGNRASQLAAIGIDRVMSTDVLEAFRDKQPKRTDDGIMLGRNALSGAIIRQTPPRPVRTAARATGGKGKMRF